MKVKSQSYLLPDNSKIELGEVEWKGPELLFDSTLIGREQGSLHQLVLDSLHKTDQNMISDLTQNIVLAGGTALMKGIDKRLLHELTEADEDIGREANIDWKYETRNISSWLGWSLLGNLTSIQSLMVSRQIYEEEGPRLLQNSNF